MRSGLGTPPAHAFGIDPYVLVAHRTSTRHRRGPSLWREIIPFGRSRTPPDMAPVVVHPEAEREIDALLVGRAVAHDGEHVLLDERARLVAVGRVGGSVRQLVAVHQ